NQPGRVRPKAQKTIQRVNVSIRCPIHMEGQHWLRKSNVGCDLRAHAPLLLENAFVDDSLNAASTPSPMFSALTSLMSPASALDQNSIRSLTVRLYLFIVRSRPNSVAASLLASVCPVKI